MNIVPWRVRAAISGRFPLVYHLAVNLFRKRMGADYWDRALAEWWGHDVRHWPAKARIVSERANPTSALIDIACGNGSLLRDLRALGFHDLSGLEISQYAVNRLREEGFVMIHGVLPHIPVADQSFDTVVVSQVLEHIIRRNIFASEIFRIMRPGGQAFLFVPNDCLGPIDEPEHVIKYNGKTFATFLSKHFEVLSVEVMKDENFAMQVLLGHVRRPPR